MSIALALFWHQHQPYYKDLVDDRMVMPWVRLHAIKDYYGMAKLLKEFPGMRCNINLVPSLVTQLLDYVERDATDPHLERTVAPADSLTGADVEFLMDNFFMAQWDRMIRCYPRYRELLEMRRFGRRTARAAGEDYSVSDLRDLQIWFLLAWFHPVCYEEYEPLLALREKGRDFTEADKQTALNIQNEVMAKVLPLHAELVANGQLELTTTPFYHPILPLLTNMENALEAMPTNPMPNGHRPLVEDAEAQVKLAMDYHERIFGARARGMWPAEGSVSPDILPILAKNGVKWIATDEEILSGSLGVGIRGGYGRLERPDLLYRPWRLPYHGEGGPMDIVFRDHHLSDLVGFQYQSWEGEAAANDFLARIDAGVRGIHNGDGALVNVILDGENCWEHYADQGIHFLRTLYGRLQDRQRGIEPVRIGDYLQNPSCEPAPLKKLFRGSWINHDYYIWIGHPEDRKGWEYVFRVREDLVEEQERRGTTAENDPKLKQAWEELYIAQGSDWYWWYGDDRTSGQDGLFDQLFRTHLKNVYEFLELPAPAFLDDPIAAENAAARYSLPGAVLKVNLDGRVTSFFEWMGAGIYRADREGGVMASNTLPLVSQICFGYDVDHLCVRIDPQEVAGSREEKEGRSRLRKVALHFTEPANLTLEIENGPPMVQRHEGPWPEGTDGAQVVWDEILELRLPFRELGAPREKPLAFFVDLTDADGMTERFPRGSALGFNVPPTNVEELEWMV